MRKNVFVFLLLICLVLYFQGERVFLSLTQQAVHFIAQKKMGCSFSCSKISLSNSSITFEGVELKDLKYQNSIQIKSLLLKPCWEKSLALSATLLEPLVQINPESLTEIFADQKDNKSSFLGKMRMEVVSGRLELQGQKNCGITIFSLQHDLAGTFLKLFCANDSYLELKIKRGEKLFECDALFEKIKLQDFESIISLIDPTCSLQGELKGSTHFSYHQGEVRKIFLDLQGEHLLGCWKESEFSAKKIDLNILLANQGRPSPLFSFIVQQKLLPMDIHAVIEEGSFTNGKEWKLAALHGFCSHQDEIGFKMELSGKAGGNDLLQPFFCESKAMFTSPFQNWANLQVAIEGQEGKFFSLHAQEISSETIKAHLIAEKMPAEIGNIFLSTLTGLIWDKGQVSGALSFLFCDGKIATLECSRLESENLALSTLNKKFSLFSAHLLASGKYIPTNLKKSSLQIHVEEGGLHYENAKEEKCEVAHFLGDFTFFEGMVHPSQCNFLGNGRKMEWHFSGSLDELKTSFTFSGDLRSIRPFMSRGESILTKDSREEAKGEIILAQDSGFYRTWGGFQIEEEKNLKDQISFAFDWKKSTPFLAIEGWVEGKQVSLGRYPFFLQAKEVLLTGIADFSLAMKEKKLSLGVDAKEFGCKTAFLEFYLPTVERETFSFSYDFETKAINSFFPFSQARVVLPAFSALFTEADGTLFWQEDLLKIEVIKAASEELRLGGEVICNFKDGCRINILSHFLEGRIEAGRKFFHHFSSNFFISIPLQGKLTSPQGGFFFSIPIGKEEKAVWGLKLALEQGNLKLADSAEIKEFQGMLQWDSEQESCILSEGSGELNLWNKKAFGLSFTQLEMKGKDHWLFDIRLQKPTWDVLRLKGFFNAQDMEVGHALLDFTFDPEACQLFGSTLHIPILATKDLDSIVRIKASSTISLPSLFSGMDQILALGLSKVSFPTIQWDEMKGAVLFDLLYGTEKKSHISLKGERLVWQGKPVHEAEFSAFILPVGLRVEKCTWDDFKAAFLLEGNREKCKLSEFQGKWGDGLACAIAGNLDGAKFDIKIKHLQADLEKLSKKFSYLSEGYLQGEVEGEGFISLRWTEGKPVWEADFDLSSERVSYRNFHLENHGPLHVFYSNSLGLVLRGLDLTISSKEAGVFLSDCKVGTLYKQNGDDQWVLKDVCSHLPKDIPAFCSHIFSTNQAWIEKLSFLNEAEIRGDAGFSSDFSLIEFEMPECYISHYKLEKVSFHHENDSSFLQFSYGDKDLRYTGDLSIHNASPKIYGQARVMEEKVHSNPLALSWSWEPDTGVIIDQIEGEFCGIDACFYENTSSINTSRSLSGSLKIDFSKASQLLPKPLGTLFSKYQAGKGYELRGRLLIGPDLQSTRFRGSLSGKAYELLDCQFKTLLARVDFSAENFGFYDVVVSDSAGLLKIPSLVFQKSKQRWNLSLPLLKVEEFRPSLLQKIHEPPEELKPLVVRKLVLSDIKGNLDDPKSISGKGRLTFVNSFKREHTVFDIPSDVIGRIFGLDLELLIPVKGTLEFEVNEGKVIFTALKNSYSENKRSKFFLADKEAAQYLDFDGNLSLNIKMKQYVLFKITEHFINARRGQYQKG